MKKKFLVAALTLTAFSGAIKASEKLDQYMEWLKRRSFINLYGKEAIQGLRYALQGEKYKNELCLILHSNHKDKEFPKYLKMLERQLFTSRYGDETAVGLCSILPRRNSKKRWFDENQLCLIHRLNLKDMENWNETSVLLVKPQAFEDLYEKAKSKQYVLDLALKKTHFELLANAVQIVEYEPPNYKIEWGYKKLVIIGAEDHYKGYRIDSFDLNQVTFLLKLLRLFKKNKNPNKATMEAIRKDKTFFMNPVFKLAQICQKKDEVDYFMKKLNKEEGVEIEGENEENN